MRTQPSSARCVGAALLAIATLGVSQLDAQKARSENESEQLGLGNISPLWVPNLNDPLPLKPSPPGPIGRRKPPVDPWWDLNGTTAGSGGPSPSGIWSTSNAFWNDNSAGTGTLSVWTNGSNAAVFSAGTDATGSYTVTVSGTITAGSILFEEGTVTLAGTATPVLTIQTVGGVTIASTINGTTTFDSSLNNVIVSVSQNWANNSSQAFIVNSGVVASGGTDTLTLNGSGSGGTTFNGVLGNGTGTLALTVNTTGGVTILTGDNTYGGTTTVTAGVLNIRHGDALGDTGGTTNTVVSSGAALELQNGIAVDNETLNTLSGTGISNGGALRNVSGDNSWAGTITLQNAADTPRINSDSGTLTIGGNINEGAGNDGLKTLTFGGAGNITVNGVISGTNDDLELRKDGSGTLALNGANSYPGPTTINGGILEANTLANGGSPSSIGAAAVPAGNLVIDGGTLRYTGSGHSTNRNYTIGVNGATFDASGSGALNFTSSTGVSFSGTGTRTFTLTGSNTGANTLRGGIGNQGGNATSLVKNGIGNWVIAGGSGYTGTTTINNGTLTVDDGVSSAGALSGTTSITVNSGGTLALGGLNSETTRINNAATIALNGGTFDTGGFSEGSTGTTGMGALTLTATSTINFGASNTSLIRFSGVGTHTDTTVLQLTNWNGVPVTGGSGDRLLFSGADPSAFIAAYDQNEVSFNGSFGYIAVDFGSFYEITAVPEPGTWIGGALAVGILGWSQRRRLRARRLRSLRG